MDSRALGNGLEADLGMADSEAPVSEFKRRRWYHRRDLRFILAVIAALALFFGHGHLSGPAKVSEDLSKVLSQADGRVDIKVLAKFPPEAFHLGVYQNVGVVRGSEGRVTTLYKVKPEDVQHLSRHYWIERIDLAPPLKR